MTVQRTPSWPRCWPQIPTPTVSPHTRRTAGSGTGRVATWVAAARLRALHDRPKCPGCGGDPHPLVALTCTGCGAIYWDEATDEKEATMSESTDDDAIDPSRRFGAHSGVTVSEPLLHALAQQEARAQETDDE